MRIMFIVSLLFAALAISLAAPTEQYEAPQIPLEVTAYSSASCSPNTDVAHISLVWDAVSRFRRSTAAKRAACAKFDHEHSHTHNQPFSQYSISTQRSYIRGHTNIRTWSWW